MVLGSIRPTLVTLHRWAGLILLPIFLIVILSGTVLSFRPIATSISSAPAVAHVDAAALGRLVEKLNAQSPVSSLSVEDAGRTVTVASTGADVAGRWDVASATRLGAADAGAVDVFAIAEKVHKQLLVGLGLIVEIASWIMLGLVVVGPLLAWRRLRNTVMGWHTAVGWLLFPLVLLAPLSGVLMTLHVGEGGTPLPRAARSVSVAEALTIAAPAVDLATLVEAHPFRGGTVMLQTGGESPATWVVTDQKAVRLVGGPSLVKQIHEGLWGGAWSGLVNLAASLALLVLAVTGPWSWFARRRRNRSVAVAADAAVLVLHASQTGTATRFAEATGRALADGGEDVAVAPLGAMRPEALRNRRIVLILASTTGEGDLPDGAHAFVAALTPDVLTGVRFALFALGDRAYARFCGGGERLRAALRAAGAEEALAPVRVDRDPSPAWSSWLDDLELGLALKPKRSNLPVVDPPVMLRLVERVRLDDPSAGETRETWGLTLVAERPLDFRPGDLLRIAPEEGAHERTYSIGTSSRSDPRRIVLTVGVERWTDETGAVRTGAASDLLTRRLKLGDTIEARVTPHVSFNPPDDPSRPVVMIATGSGIAPFYGFAAERAASGRSGPNWLIFGNRVEAADFLWREHFEAALAVGTLTRLDTAFSPEAGVGTRVQERLLLVGAEIRRWIVDRGAILYVCGRRVVVDGVSAALAEVFVRHAGMTPAAAEAEVNRRIGEGLVRIDSFG